MRSLALIAAHPIKQFTKFITIIGGKAEKYYNKSTSIKYIQFNNQKLRLKHEDITVCTRSVKTYQLHLVENMYYTLKKFRGLYFYIHLTVKELRKIDWNVSTLAADEEK